MNAHTLVCLNICAHKETYHFHQFTKYFNSYLGVQYMHQTSPDIFYHQNFRGKSTSTSPHDRPMAVTVTAVTSSFFTGREEGGQAHRIREFPSARSFARAREQRAGELPLQGFGEGAEKAVDHHPIQRSLELLRTAQTGAKGCSKRYMTCSWSYEQRVYNTWNLWMPHLVLKMGSKL